MPEGRGRKPSEAGERGWPEYTRGPVAVNKPITNSGRNAVRFGYSCSAVEAAF
jgi:hypothetical protein